MRRTRLIVTTATSAAIAALVLAGCGSESSTTGTDKPASGTSPSTKPSPVDNGVAALPATAILEKAKQALLAAESFHYAGKIPGGDEDSFSPMAFDFTIAKAKGAKGTVQFGGLITLIATPTTYYVQGDETYYKDTVGVKDTTALKGKWVQDDPKVPDLMFPQFITAEAVVEHMLTIGESGTSMSKLDPKAIAGVQAIGLKINEGDAEGVVWVATTGAPYPLLVELEASGDKGGSIQFDQFNAPVDITPPAPADIIPAKKYFEITVGPECGGPTSPAC